MTLCSILATGTFPQLLFGLMLPDIICYMCYHLRKQKWQRLQTVLTAVMQQDWMHHVCCQTITFLADLWKCGDSSDSAYTYRRTHLSLVTVTWLIKISYVAMTVAYLFLTCNRTAREGGREGGKRRKLLAAHQERREGLTQLMCFPSPLLSPVFLCTPVLSSRLSSSDVR